jgi:hypothetical protein
MTGSCDVPRDVDNPFLKAGLLTPGSSYFLRLPVLLCGKQWPVAGFVPGYSGGTVPAFLSGFPIKPTRGHLQDIL